MEAYDLWAENYDAQPGNLMLDLDEVLFSKLVKDELIKGRSVADIGCGTGRHWDKLFGKRPALLTGFDVSPGMLNKLNGKFPDAEICVIADNHFTTVSDSFFDTIISTLTMAHIENLVEALKAWSRILKNNGDIIITDFHPAILAEGGKRTFSHNGTQIAVQNFVHTTTTIKAILSNCGFHVVAEEEMSIDETVKHYYEQQNAIKVYEKYKGFPAIYGIHFRRLR